MLDDSTPHAWAGQSNVCFMDPTTGNLVTISSYHPHLSWKLANHLFTLQSTHEPLFRVNRKLQGTQFSDNILTQRDHSVSYAKAKRHELRWVKGSAQTGLTRPAKQQEGGGTPTARINTVPHCVCSCGWTTTSIDTQPKPLATANDVDNP